MYSRLPEFCYMIYKSGDTRVSFQENIPKVRNWLSTNSPFEFDNIDIESLEYIENNVFIECFGMFVSEFVYNNKNGGFYRNDVSRTTFIHGKYNNYANDKNRPVKYTNMINILSYACMDQYKPGNPNYEVADRISFADWVYIYLNNI